ncbi:MAG: DUF4321 domain-containing protein [Peptostreptococcales bacterium]
MARRNSNLMIIILFILIGSVAGSFIGQMLAGVIDLFSYSKTIGVTPFTVDLGFLQFTLGLVFVMNLATVVGIIVALIVYKLLR